MIISNQTGQPAYGNLGLRGVRGLRGYGAASPTQPGVNCPATGSWEAWCDCMWPGNVDPAMNSKCRAQPWGFATAAPWTEVGAGQRGIPKPGSIIAAAITSVTGGAAPTFPVALPQQPAAQPAIVNAPPAMLNTRQFFDQTVSALPPVVQANPGISAGMAIGAAALVGGAIFLATRKKGGGSSAPLMGYRRRRRSRR